MLLPTCRVFAAMKTYLLFERVTEIRLEMAMTMVQANDGRMERMEATADKHEL